MEYIAISEAVKEVMFVLQLLRSMKIAAKYPVMVRVENVEAIFMARSNTMTYSTKHVVIRYKYANEYVENRVVKIVFINSADNNSNIFKKKLRC